MIREDFNVIGTRINRPIRLRWNHNQDQAAHPYQSFGGSMDIQTNGYNRSVNIYSTNVLDNTLNSNLTYNRIITNSPFSLNASFRHFQNLRTKAVEIILPSLSINMRTVNPFKNNNRVTNEERWYDKISVNYNSRAINKLNTTDTALFTKNHSKICNTALYIMPVQMSVSEYLNILISCHQLIIKRNGFSETR